MAPNMIKYRIPGPLETCSQEAEEYYRTTLGQLDFGKGRKIQTEHGSTWTYKLGPSDGTRVFFIHGINTSCHSLANIAVPLSERGYQVLLYDLYGRGLSDGTTAKHDEELYITQAMAVLKEFGWAKDIAIIGYSMGGSIAVHLNKEQPDLIKHLILLAPAGMIRHRTFGFDKIAVFRFRLLTTEKRHDLIKRNLLEGIEKVLKKNSQGRSRASADVRLQEAVCRSRKWFMEKHEGFVQAIDSSVSKAPLCGQDEVWEKLKERKGTTKVVLGSEDDKVILSEFEKDVACLRGGADHLHLETLEGADHHFPMTHAPKVLEIIESMLGRKVAPE